MTTADEHIEEEGQYRFDERAGSSSTFIAYVSFHFNFIAMANQFHCSRFLPSSMTAFLLFSDKSLLLSIFPIAPLFNQTVVSRFRFHVSTLRVFVRHVLRQAVLTYIPPWFFTPALFLLYKLPSPSLHRLLYFFPIALIFLFRPHNSSLS